MEAVRNRHEGLVNYNIDSVLEDAMDMIEKLGIKIDNDIKSGTKELIAMFIAINIMQAIRDEERGTQKI
jgi:hypothetical protein